MFKRLIRSKALRSRTALIITGVLVLPFLFFFHMYGRSSRQGTQENVGTVFGEPIAWKQFNQELLWVRLGWANRLGEIPEGFEPFLTRATWERLMLIEEAKHMRLKVTDRELADFIQQSPSFQVDGRFLPERYHRYVRALGMTTMLYEQFVQEELLIEKLIEMQRSTVLVTEGELREAFNRAHERRSASFIVQQVETFRDAVESNVTDEDLQAEYEASIDAVRTLERLTVDYAGVTKDSLRETLTISEEATEEEYANDPEEFTDKEGNPLPLDEAHELIRQRLLDRQVGWRLVALAIDLEEGIDTGTSFEDLAKAHELKVNTIGPITLNEASSLNEPESMLLGRASSLKDLESELVENDDAVYVLSVREREPSRIPSLDEVRETIKERVVVKLAREAALQEISQLREKLAQTLTKPMSFEEACSELDVTHTPPTSFNRSEPIEGLGDAPTVNAAAFSTPEGELSYPIETDGRLVLIMVHEHIPADESAWTDEEEERLRKQVLAEKQRSHLAQWLEDLRERAAIESFLEDSPADS